MFDTNQLANSLHPKVSVNLANDVLVGMSYMSTFRIFIEGMDLYRGDAPDVPVLVRGAGGSVNFDMYHGRKDPDEEMDGWGSQGPVLTAEAAVITKEKVKLYQLDGSVLEIPFVNWLLHYEGVYYGDIVVGVADAPGEPNA